MPLASYKLSRKFQKSNPREEMKRTKRLQVESLYNLAVDREDNALLNGEPFVKSPRVFDVRTTDESHTKLLKMMIVLKSEIMLRYPMEFICAYTLLFFMIYIVVEYFRNVT